VVFHAKNAVLSMKSGWFLTISAFISAGWSGPTPVSRFPPKFLAKDEFFTYIFGNGRFKEVLMPFLQEDMDIIKSKFEEWLGELAPELKPGVYDLELRNRMLKVEEELKHQRELMQQGFNLMEKRFEQVDKRFESMQQAMDKRFEQMDKRFESMQQTMDKRFEQVDKRFESMQQTMDKRFEQMDKRFEALTARMDTFMRWSFGLTLTVGGIVIAVLKYT
jgi:chaperonin cofactor prefoldin